MSGPIQKLISDENCLVTILNGHILTIEIAPENSLHVIPVVKYVPFEKNFFVPKDIFLLGRELSLPEICNIARSCMDDSSLILIKTAIGYVCQHNAMYKEAQEFLMGIKKTDESPDVTEAANVLGLVSACAFIVRNPFIIATKSKVSYIIDKEHKRDFPLI